jgi:rhodanese-related sulfurtransferase
MNAKGQTARLHAIAPLKRRSRQEQSSPTSTPRSSLHGDFATVIGIRCLPRESRVNARGRILLPYIPARLLRLGPDALCILNRIQPVFRGAGELRRRYRRLGAAPGKTIVVYCQVGVQASKTYFTLKHLGYDVRLYDGSFAQWSRAKDAPVAH